MMLVWLLQETYQVIIRKSHTQNIKTLLKQYQFQISLLPGNHDDLNNMIGICDDQISLDRINIKNSNFSAHNIDTHIQDNVQGCIKDNDMKK